MLTSSEKEAFVRDGYVLKKALLDEVSRRRCLDATWKILASLGISEDPSSWHNAYSRRGVVKLREQIDGNNEISEPIVNCTAVHDVVRALIGPKFINEGVRGVYPTLPIPRRISRPYEPHIEHHPCQVVVMYYLDDVIERNGGLLVWPGSHRSNYTAHTKRFDFSAKPKFLREFRQRSPCRPFEVTGSAGDVLFFHHRLFHSGSNNFQNTIRFGVLNDFIPENFDEIRDDEPTADNMWDYWSEDLQQTSQQLMDCSPLTTTSNDMVRRLLISAFEIARKLKGSHANEYEEKIANASDATSNDDQT